MKIFGIIASVVIALSVSAFAEGEGTERIYDYLKIGQIPEMVDTGRPCYPDSAYKARCEGAVLVDVVIDEEGKVVDAKVAEAQPEGVFDAVALDAALRCRFEPIKIDGKAVKVRYRIPYIFDRGQYNLKRCSKIKKK